jgi:hypothetical protein
LGRKQEYQNKLIEISNDLFGCVDGLMMSSFRLTEDDKACEILLDDELSLFTKEDLTFCEKRKLLIILKEKIYDRRENN